MPDKRLFLILLIGLTLFAASLTPSALAQNAKAKLISPEPKLASPNDFLTCVFVLTNLGVAEDTYQFSVSSPKGWPVVTKPRLITLSPQQEKKIPITMGVSFAAIAAPGYRVKLTAISQRELGVKVSAEALIEVTQLRKVHVIAPPGKKMVEAGKQVSFYFTVVNQGNGPDRFKILANSAHQWPFTLSKRVLRLNPGQRQKILVNLSPSEDAWAGTKDFITFKACSVEDKRVCDERRVYAVVLPRAEKVSNYRTVPAQTRLRVSGLGTEEPSSLQGEFKAGGNFNDEYGFNFQFRRKSFREQKRFLGRSRLGQEILRLDLNSSWGDISAGDTYANFSKLTRRSVSGKGGRLHFKSDSLNTTFFYGKSGIIFREKEDQLRKTYRGLNLTYTAGEKTTIGANYIDIDKDKSVTVPLTAAERAQKKKILSLTSTYNPTKEWSLCAEYAGSSFNDNVDTLKDTAWSVCSLLDTDKFYLNGEFIRAGSDYQGDRSDEEGYRINARCRLIKPLSLLTYLRRTFNNVSNNPGLPTVLTQVFEIGPYLTIEKMPSLRVSFKVDKRKSHGASPFTGWIEKTISVNTYKSYGPVSFSASGKWGGERDRAADVKYDLASYEARLNVSNPRLYLWWSFTRDKKDDDYREIRESYHRKEVGIRYTLIPQKLFTSFRVSKETSTQSRPTAYTRRAANTLVGKITSKFTRDSEFAFELEKSDFINDNTGGRVMAWLTFTSKFDLAIPWIKERGKVKGVVFMDRNSNGRRDRKEKKFTGLILNLDEKQAITNKKGVFIFPGLDADLYELSIDTSSLPAGISPTLSMPKEINLAKGRTAAVNIPLIKVGRIEGVIFDDKNKNGKRDVKEKGIGAIKLVLAGNPSAPQEAFSGNDGKYSFTDVLPGKYKVSVDKLWLPERYILTTPEEFQIALDFGGKISRLDFGAGEKGRPIIRTF